MCAPWGIAGIKRRGNLVQWSTYRVLSGYVYRLRLGGGETVSAGYGGATGGAVTGGGRAGGARRPLLRGRLPFRPPEVLQVAQDVPVVGAEEVRVARRQALQVTPLSVL